MSRWDAVRYVDGVHDLRRGKRRVGQWNGNGGRVRERFRYRRRFGGPLSSHRSFGLRIRILVRILIRRTHLDDLGLIHERGRGGERRVANHGR